MRIQYQLSNGSRIDAGDRTQEFLGYALEYRKTVNAKNKNLPILTMEQMLEKLANRYEIKFGTDWYEVISDADSLKTAPEPKPVEMKKCSCGHTVPAISVMSASMGSSCVDCYDRMSN